MKHTIEIEGLPEGYEPTAAKVVDTATENCVAVIALRRKVRKYDWSKTLGDVLVKNDRDALMKSCEWRHPTKWLSDLWQPNIHGKCPVDPEASIIEVRFADGSTASGVPGSYSIDSFSFDWSLRASGEMIVAWRFLRLANGYEW